MKGLGNFLEHNWFFSLLGTYFVFWWPIACVRSFLNSKIQIDDGRENLLDYLLTASLRLHFFAVQDFFGKLPNPPCPLLELKWSVPYQRCPTLPHFLHLVFTLKITHYRRSALRVCLELAKVCGDGGGGTNMTLISLYSYDLCLRIRSFHLLQKLCNAVPSTAYLASHCKHTLKDLLVVLEIPPSLLMHRLLSSTA